MLIFLCNKHLTVLCHIWQHECDGWYFYSNISNRNKANDLQLISEIKAKI